MSVRKRLRSEVRYSSKGLKWKCAAFCALLLPSLETFTRCSNATRLLALSDKAIYPPLRTFDRDPGLQSSPLMRCRDALACPVLYQLIYKQYNLTLRNYYFRSNHKIKVLTRQTALHNPVPLPPPKKNSWGLMWQTAGLQCVLLELVLSFSMLLAQSHTAAYTWPIRREGTWNSPLSKFGFMGYY